ncbi:hypothetical protein HaLaN_12107 [Haematococcus lacustris]|uniref:Uncharacterized protein n=1 Tax=Haematococcus lacustris TaxID=44745 RepID=A0A699Z9C7_HAELA|nr:hypothetical protein HaLaN_12107 [Haematococcus lacustris]
MQLEEEAAMVSQQRWWTRKQLVVFFGNAGIGTRGLPQGGGEAKSGKQTDKLPGKLAAVDELSSAVNSPQPCEEELDRSNPTRPEGWKPRRPAWNQRCEAPVRGFMLSSL